MFAGRVEEVVALNQILLQTKNGNAQHFLISGERGIGKSSLMFFVKTIASGRITSGDGIYRFLVVDITLEAGYQYADIVRLIAAELKAALNPFNKTTEAVKAVWDVLKNVEAAGISYKGKTIEPEDYELLNGLVDALVEATKALASEIDGILILIDEADKPPVESNLGAMVKILTERLSKDGCENVCIGLAGVTGIIPKLRSSHESSPRIFEVLALKPLELVEREEVVDLGLKAGNDKNADQMTITPEARELIGSLSEGFPHFIQQFAYSAFEQDTDNKIDVPDVLEGANKENGALDQLGEKYFQQMYYEKIGTNEYRAVLRAMAQATGEGWITKAQIREATGLKETTLGNALHILKEREIIAAKLGEKGVYRLPSLSFAAWIRARNSGDELGKSLIP